MKHRSYLRELSANWGSTQIQSIARGWATGGNLDLGYVVGIGTILSCQPRPSCPYPLHSCSPRISSAACCPDTVCQHVCSFPKGQGISFFTGIRSKYKVYRSFARTSPERPLRSNAQARPSPYIYSVSITFAICAPSCHCLRTTIADKMMLLRVVVPWTILLRTCLAQQDLLSQLPHCAVRLPFHFVDVLRI